MSDEYEDETVVVVSRENLVRGARLLSNSLMLLADRIENPNLLAWHEVLSEAAGVFSDVGVIIDANGPEIIRAWLCEQRRIAAVAAQN